MEKYIDAIKWHHPIQIKCSSNKPETIQELNKVLEIILTSLDLLELFNSLQFVLRELINNGKRANIKRIHFSDKGVDIRDRNLYDKELALFAESFSDHLEYFHEELTKQNFYVETTFLCNPDSLEIKVVNNSPLLEFEKKRIDSKIELAKNFKGMEDALANVFDTVESGGLGLLMIQLSLKKAGMEEQHFSITSDDVSTTVHIIMPLDHIKKGSLSQISQNMVDKLQSLPRFPENIMHLMKLLNEQDSTLKEIAVKIRQDPTLTVDLLKLSNSAAFMMRRRINTIEDSVKIIGFKGVESLLLSCAINQSFYQKGDKILQNLWQHANEVAFYSKKLASKLRLRNLSEDAFICGLLHDLGKIVIRAQGNNLISNIKNFCSKNELDIELLENIAVNTTHARIGRLICIKWGLPDIVSETIGMHHTPHIAPDNIKTLVNIVYLADIFSNYDKYNPSFDKLYAPVMEFFNLKSCEDLLKLKTSMSDDYLEQQNLLKEN